MELATHLRAVLQADERLEQATRRALERARGELSQMADGRRALHAYRGWSGPRISRFVDAER